MRVLIVDHPRPLSLEHYNDVANAPLSASLNTGYAAAVVEEAGHDCQYVEFLDADAAPETMAETMLAHDPHMVLLHWVYAWDNGNAGRRVVESLREAGFGGAVGAFGLFPTFCAEDLLDDTPGLDMVFVGEFEETLGALLKDGRLERPIPPMPGLCMRSGNGGRRELVADLSTLPLPRELGGAARLDQVNVAASRGCYGHCSFCFIHPFYGRSLWRPRAVQEVLAEIEARTALRNCRDLYFVDPNFFGPGEQGQHRAMELAAGLASQNVRFGLEGRVNDIHLETIQTLARAGLQSVFLGIESASPEVLKRARKGITPEQSAHALRILRDAGVRPAVGFIMFEPDSTVADVRTNFDFLRDNALLENSDLSSNLLSHNQILLKGSPAYAALLEAGRLDISEDTPFEGRPIWRDPAVGAIQEAMAQLSLAYFRGRAKRFAEAAQEGARAFPEEAVNTLLVQLFETFLDAAEKTERSGLPELARESCSRMNSLLAVDPT